MLTREEVEKKVDAKLSFYKHLIVYICINSMLLIINILTSYGEWWFYWVSLFWGIGLIINFLEVFAFNKKEIREKMIEKEMNKK